MKKIRVLFAILVMAFLASGLTSCSKVESGYVGVKVNLLGSSKGVQNEVLGVGRYYIGINEELYVYPTFQINYVYTKNSNEGSTDNEEFTFQTKEGMECSCDLGVAAHFDANKITTMFQTYRKGPDEIRSIVIRNEVRDALNKVAGAWPIESVYGAGKGKLIDTIKTIVRSKLKDPGIVIDNLYLIGSVRIPATVKAALDAKVTATQQAMQAENEVRKAEATAKIEVAQAEGKAKAMDVIGDAIRRNPSILQQKAIEAWDGKLPVYMGGNGPIPFLTIK